MYLLSLSVLSVLLVLSSSGIVVQSSTIPCPGFEDPSTFDTIPLSDRPKLSKILQNGYQPKLLTATLPSRDGFNLVQTHEGFVDRPFRRITPPDQCPQRMNGSIVSGLQCFGSQFGLSSGFLDADPTEHQVLLDLSRRWTLPMVDSYLNPSYTDEWANEVRQFMADNKVDCQEDTTSRLFAVEKYECIVGGCFEIEPDFVDDLFLLNTWIGDDETNLGAFENFIEKWGHGSVENFSFGAMEYQIYDLPDDNASMQQANTMDFSTLYMGRAGGSAATITSERDGQLVGNLYTEEECVDPAPVFLDYTPWEDILPDLFPIWYADVYNTTALDMDGIREKFRELRETYRSLSEEIEDVGLSFVDCPRLDPGALTASPSSSTAPTNMPTSSNMPTTTSTTEVPTTTNSRMPTTSPTMEPSILPTNSPTARTSMNPSAPPSAGGGTSSSLPSLAPSPNQNLATTQVPTMTLSTAAPTSNPSAEPSTTSTTSASSSPTGLASSFRATNPPSSSNTSSSTSSPSPDVSTNESDDDGGGGDGSGAMSMSLSNVVVFTAAMVLPFCFGLVL